jgi:hypothetical protein
VSPATAQATGVTQEALASLWSDTPEEEIKYRGALNKAGQQVMKDGEPLMLAYVTARYVQDRLDTAVGPSNWQTMFADTPTGAVRCGIGILCDRDARPERDERPEWVWKWDVGIPSNIEPDKGAHSDAFKRAGVQWGIARDLYDDRDEQSGPAAKTAAASAAAPAPAPTQNVRQAIYAPGAVDDGEWVCPIHDDVKVVPAGVSKKSGKAYSAFRACPVPGCNEKEPYPVTA